MKTSGEKIPCYVAILQVCTVTPFSAIDGRACCISGAHS